MFIESPELLGPTHDLFGGFAWNTVSRINDSGAIIFLKNLFVEAQHGNSLNRIFWGSDTYRILIHHPETYIIAQADTFEEIVEDWEVVVENLCPILDTDAHKFTEEDLIEFLKNPSVKRIRSGASPNKSSNSSSSYSIFDQHPNPEKNEDISSLNLPKSDSYIFAIPDPKPPRYSTTTSPPKSSRSTTINVPTSSVIPSQNVGDMISLISEIEKKKKDFGNDDIEPKYIPLQKLYKYLDLSADMPELIIKKIIDQYEETPLHEAWKEKCQMLKEEKFAHKQELIDRINEILGPAFLHYLRTQDSIQDLQDDKKEIQSIHAELERAGSLDFQELPAVSRIDQRISEIIEQQHQRQSLSRKRLFSGIDYISEEEEEEEEKIVPESQISYTKIFREPLSEEEDHSDHVHRKSTTEEEMFSDEDSDLSFFRESRSSSSTPITVKSEYITTTVTKTVTTPANGSNGAYLTNGQRYSVGSIAIDGASEELEHPHKRQRSESSAF